MRLAAVFLPALAHAGVLERAGGCNANNCARAVTGTRDKEPNVTVRQAQCSSFQLITVTPDPFTSTITASVTQTVTATELATRTLTESKSVTQTDIIWAKRAVTVSPSVVPAYATACPNAAAYASACSCWGITRSTTQAPTPTVFVAVTVSPTVTATATVTDHTATNTVTHTATVTLQGDRQCQNAVTGCRSNFPRCPAGYDALHCLCGDSPGGVRHCFSIRSTLDFCNDHAPCRTSADCAAGNTCITGTSTCCTLNGDREAARCWPTARLQCPSQGAAVRRQLSGGQPEVMVSREEGAISPLWVAEGGPIAGGD